MNSSDNAVMSLRIFKEEYDSVRKHGAGLIDLSPRGRIRVSGTEAVTFLNGLITNDMKTLGENTWMPAVFPNVQGRLIAAVRVVRLPDDEKSPAFLIDTEEATHEKVLKAIERFTLAGDFKVFDLTSQTSLISVQGKDAAEIISAGLSIDVTSLSKNGVLNSEWNGHSLTVVHATHTAEDGFDFIISTEGASSLKEALLGSGARLIAPATFETLRIEAGVPSFGRDMDETNVVSETNLDDSISFTKGCYVGQEIIARIKYRGHVAKKLSGLVLEGDVDLGSHNLVKRDDKEIGRITSFNYSPTLERTIALGYVRFEHTSPGTKLVVTGDGVEAKATVTELPFVRGSWYSEGK